MELFYAALVVAGVAVAIYYVDKARKGRPRGGYGDGNDKGGDTRPH